MANPSLLDDINSPHPFHVRAIGQASIGVTGTPTMQPTRQGSIFKSISRTATGTYDVFLNEAWPSDGAVQAALMISPQILSSLNVISDGYLARWAAAQINNTTTPKFTIMCVRTDTQAAADPPNGSVLVWGFDAMMVVP